MKLDEDNPCPHCGASEILTKDRDLKPVIPKELQYDFSKDVDDQSNKFIPPSVQENHSSQNLELTENPDLRGTISDLDNDFNPATKRVSQNLPLESLFPTIDDVDLDPASQRVYYQLSVEFQIILNKAGNYREGLYRWNLILPDRLQEYGLTKEAWEKICSIGDGDPRIQSQLNYLLGRIFN
jgi:hypothetical protein